MNHLSILIENVMGIRDMADYIDEYLKISVQFPIGRS